MKSLGVLLCTSKIIMSLFLDGHVTLSILVKLGRDKIKKSIIEKEKELMTLFS